MPIIPWRSFRDFDRWFEEHPFFSPHRFAREFEEEWPERWFEFPRVPMIRTPRMDIYEDNGNVIAEVELPGVDSKNIDIEVKDNYLKVEAKGEEKKEEKGKGYYRKELSRGFFKRVVPLPVEVVGEKAAAVYKDGVLKVVIPKAKPKKEEKKGIKVKVK